MRIDFLGLQAFLSIAERGSFGRAAAHLNLSQTAVSHRLRKLENDLGVKLLARTTREVTLTRAGIDFLPKAQKAVAELEHAFDDLSQQGARRRARLDFACLPALAVGYLPLVLSRFHRRQPHVELRLLESPSAAVADLVRSGEAELGLSVIQANRWDLQVEAIATAPLALACPPRHELGARRSLGWEELRELPLIRVGATTAIRSMIDDTLAAAGLSVGWKYEVQRVETAVNLVESGLGFTIVPSIDIALHRGRGVRAVQLRGPKVSCTYGLVMRRGMPLSPPAETLRALLIEVFKSKGDRHAASA